MTLTYKLDLDIIPLDLHTKDQVYMFVRSAVRVFTDTYTHTQTMSKLLHPLLTRGVITYASVVIRLFCKGKDAG